MLAGSTQQGSLLFLLDNQVVFRLLWPRRKKLRVSHKFFTKHSCTTLPLMQHLVSRIQWSESFNQQKWEIAQKYRSHTCKRPYVTNVITHNHCMLVLSGESRFSCLTECMYLALKCGCMKFAHCPMIIYFYPGFEDEKLVLITSI